MKNKKKNKMKNEYDPKIGFVMRTYTDIPIIIRSANEKKKKKKKNKKKKKGKK